MQGYRRICIYMSAKKTGFRFSKVVVGRGATEAAPALHRQSPCREAGAKGERNPAMYVIVTTRQNRSRTAKRG
jgi:hypothetical protein